MCFIHMDSPQSHHKVSYIDFGTHQLSQFLRTKICLLLTLSSVVAFCCEVCGKRVHCSAIVNALSSFCACEVLQILSMTY